jgi:protein tyrosine phosphatase
MNETLEDFWRMVWLCGTHVVVMCTNLEEGGTSKCARYWPDGPGALAVGPFTVLADETQHPAPQYQLTK